MFSKVNFIFWLPPGFLLLHTGTLWLWGAGAVLQCGTVFSPPGGQASEVVGFVVVANGLSCSLACGILPAGTEPVSPALSGGFLSTVLPRSPHVALI